ncbi:MAG: glutathione S-transferase N-terminal domain-containing protein [Pseudomonadota bacterium]
MTRYKLYGGGGSPYSMKMRAILRYRRLGFDWYQITPEMRQTLKHDGPPVIPILQLPEDASLHVDSTPLAYLLEARHSERSIIPDDPALAYVCDLLEDMADEWCTKMMFHYRWYRTIDQAYSSRQIISDNTPGVRGAELDKLANAIRERQVSRMPLVGCTENNAPVIEQSYLELLDILDSFVTRDEFLLGTRPSLGDFGLFGQLKTLSSDHTPMLIMRERTPSVYDWVRRLDDASGIEGQWHRFDELRPAASALLEFTGKWYLPFLTANATAVAQGDAELEVTLDGQAWVQAPFKYQAKCYDRLRKRLAATDSRPLRDLLAATGCLGYLEGE